MLRDRKPVPSGGGHQGNLSNLKHLVSISEKEREKVCFVKVGGHLVGVRG